MKGLLLKDWYTLLRQAKIFVVLVVIFSFMPGAFMSSFAIIYTAMLPITALAYDERAKWDTLASMMPYSAGEIVFSKYLLGYLSILAAILLSVVAGTTRSLLGHTTPESGWIFALVLTACVAALMLAVNLPIMFRFGVEKGRMAFFAVIAVFTVAGCVFGDRLAVRLDALTIRPGLLALDALLLTAAVSFVSVRLSAKFYAARGK